MCHVAHRQTTFTLAVRCSTINRETERIFIAPRLMQRVPLPLRRLIGASDKPACSARQPEATSRAAPGSPTADLEPAAIARAAVLGERPRVRSSRSTPPTEKQSDGNQIAVAFWLQARVRNRPTLSRSSAQLLRPVGVSVGVANRPSYFSEQYRVISWSEWRRRRVSDTPPETRWQRYSFVAQLNGNVGYNACGVACGVVRVIWSPASAPAMPRYIERRRLT